MVKLSNTALVKPLSLTLQNYSNDGVFPYHWKKLKILPIQKKRRQAYLKTRDWFHFLNSGVKYLGQ